DVFARADPAADLDAAQRGQLGYLGVEDLFRQVPVRDPGPQHAARFLQRLEDHRRVPTPPQVVGAGQARWPGADDRDRGAVQLGQVAGDRILRQGEPVVAEEPLHAADPDRLVVRGPGARRL